jgi:hypothetical protein
VRAISWCRFDVSKFVNHKQLFGETILFPELSIRASVP